MNRQPTQSEAAGETGVSPLSAHIQIRAQFGRSVNLERDSASALVEDYLPGTRALDMLRRFARAMQDPDTTRAWSITGPYGSGKSSFALFLHALAGPSGDSVWQAASRVLRCADAELAYEVEDGRIAQHAQDRGFVRAVVIAEREPASVSLARALDVGIRGYWRGNDVPERVQRLHQQVGTAEQTPNQLSRVVVQLAVEVAKHAPLLLVIDEFGKNLEAFADGGAAADYFVLQQLAERASGERGAPVFFITLQHQAFEEYATRAITPQLRREWGKVQGRFEDVPFVETGEHATRLIASVVDATAANKAFRKRISTWSKKMFEACEALGLGSLFGSDAGLLGSCYPLHPLTVLALPELCARYAQHERTLMSFLAGGEPLSVDSWLATVSIRVGGLQSVGLDQLYTYFLQSANSVVLGSAEASRWLEIQRRVEEADDLEPESLRCLRSIAILNLVSAGGVLRASEPLVSLALSYSTGTDQKGLREQLKVLENKGLVTYRKHADEYRVWQGTDLDLSAVIDGAKQRLQESSLSLQLQGLNPLPPVVAARHSQRTGILRYFAAEWVDRFTGVPATPEGADGVLLYVVGEEPIWEDVGDEDPRPRIVVRTMHTESLRESVLEAAAIKSVLEEPDLVGNDWVARRELQERFALAELRMRDFLVTTFAPGSPGVTWRRLGDSQDLPATGTASRILSDVCDAVYDHSPVIQNEMLARRNLTSQGSKARRDLLEAMISQQSQERLGIVGYGPERAIYESVLRHTGLHSRGDQDGTWRFGQPHGNSGLAGVWSVLDQLLLKARGRRVSIGDIYRALMNPPVGLKDGPIPVLITALLLDHADDIALYEDGTYQPLLTVDLIERLVKLPDTFSLKVVWVEGARGAIIHRLGETLRVPILQRGKRRNLPVLSVVSPLLARVRSLPEYSLRTKRISKIASDVRAALLAAAEPDVLIFRELPTACGIPEFVDLDRVGPAEIESYVQTLFAALSELEGLFPRLQEEIRKEFAGALRVPDNSDLRFDVEARARHLSSRVLERGLRALVLAMADANLEDDEDWVQNLAMNVVGKPPQTWRDDDLVLFESNLSRLAGAFLRVEALYFEAAAQKREGFDAKRITVTAPDGTEYNDVVWVAQDSVETLNQILDHALASANAKVGLDCSPALLALLASRLHSENQEREGELGLPGPESTEGGLRNG